MFSRVSCAVGVPFALFSMLLTVGILLGFFIAFLGDNFISYLAVASTSVTLFVVFFRMMHRTTSQ
jgi:hypothetical protein